MTQVSYYSDPTKVKEQQSSAENRQEIKCKRCYGTGEDDDGADCVYCLGFGTILM